MAFGLPNPYSAEGQEAQIAALEELYGTVPVYATFSALPDPASLIDGTIVLVLELLESGQAGVVVVRSGAWTLPAAAQDGTVSFVGKAGAGAGELPENIVVASGATVVVGTGFALEAAQTVVRPSGIAVLPLDPASLEVGAQGAGLWRVAVQLNYSVDAPAAAMSSHFVLQTDVGSGFVDVPSGELFRLEQEASAPVSGISQVGIFINIAVAVGNKFRLGLRHSANASRTYTIHHFAVAANLFQSPLT